MLDTILKTAPDVVALDVNLPGLSGLEVLARLRRTSDVPVLLLTGRAEETDRVLGLELGADDDVVKPFFAVRELGARVRALLRRVDRRARRLAGVRRADGRHCEPHRDAW